MKQFRVEFFRLSTEIQTVTVDAKDEDAAKDLAYIGIDEDDWEITESEEPIVREVIEL